MSNLGLDVQDFNRFSRQGRKSKITGTAEVIRYLRRYQPETLRAMRKDMRTDIRPIAAPIVSEINSTITNQLMSRDYEMFHNGRTQWTGARYTPQVTSNRNGIVKLRFTGKKGGLGFDYAELAGVRRRPPRNRSKGWYSNAEGYHSYDYAGQGDVFINRLNKDFGKPGRFAWIRIIKKRAEIDDKIRNIFDRYNIKLNAKLRGGPGSPGGIL